MDYKTEIGVLVDEVVGREQDYFRKLFNTIKKNKSKYICIWGTGLFAIGFLKTLKSKNIKIDFLCDNDSKKTGKVYDGVKCVSPQECFELKDEVLILVASKYYKNIALQLVDMQMTNFYEIETASLRYLKSMTIFLEERQKMDFVKEKFIRILSLCCDEESKRICFRLLQNWFVDNPAKRTWDDLYCGKLHFDNSILKLTNKEKFVDCGAFNGDTIFEFLQEVEGQFNQIYAFEMGMDNYYRLQKTVGYFRESISSKISLKNIGVWDKQDSQCYVSLGAGSNICLEGTCKVELDSLDNLLGMENISFIKMDIEGAELEALRGAECLIKKYRPKMAISIYHKLEHLWEIPLFLKKLVPEYKIYIRHHSMHQDDTICYAIL